uniref:Zgc:136472 n=1 Tax=Seriola dumerili TaxID=41447 RepID=A0A3B4V0L3_SERDU
MRRLLLLGVTAFCLCVFVAADTQQNRQGEKSLPEKDGVLQLKKGNFNRALRKYKQLLVHFYAPLSGEGYRVSAAFEGAAAKLQESEVKLAVVDVTKEKDLAKDLNATGPPTIRLYLAGDKQNPVPCPVPQSSASILTWLKRRAGSAADLITDLSQSEASDELTVVGFFKELDQEYAQMFYSAAVDLPDVNFVVTQNNEVISKYGLTHDVVLLLKKTATQILTSPVLNHALLFVNKSSADFEEIHSAFNNAAEAFRLKVYTHTHTHTHTHTQLMEYFRVRDFEAPLIRLVNLTDHVTYHLPSDTLDVGIIKQFCQSYLEGKAKPKMQSEPIPEGWDKKLVKELVGMTLEKVAFNPDKTVFVLFYLPYSQESRALFPLWEELAEALKERGDVVVARIDASANDINMSMKGSYPSLCLFPALYAERMVVYTGKRKLKDLVKFVDKEMEKAKKDRVKVNHLSR